MKKRESEKSIQTSVNKKLFASKAYFWIIFTIGVIATYDEDISTILIVNLWFSLPMTIGYFTELYYFKKISNVAYFLIAIVNTIILFIILEIIGCFISYHRGCLV